MKVQGEAISELDEAAISDVLNGIPVGVLVIDLMERVLVLNTALEKMLGIDAEQAVGRDVREVFGEQRRILQDGRLFLTLKTGQEFHYVKQRPQISLRTCPLRNNLGKIVGAMAVFQDFSYQQELEQSVIKAERLAIMGQLCAMAVHEIKNSLAAVRGYLQLLKKELKGSFLTGRVDTMLIAVDKINNITTNFLRLAKPAIPQRKPCHLPDLVKGALKLMEGEIERRSIAINLFCEPELPAVMVDEEQIHQVLLNILTNAFEAINDGGEVTVRVLAVRKAGILRIEIEDSGPGMEDDLLCRVFEPFFTTKKNGTGLGLYICRMIIKNHKGDIRIENKPERGCKVVIILPQAENYVKQKLL